MSLAEVGKVAFELFDRVIQAGQSTLNDNFQACLQRLEGERDRFEIWAVDLGLLMPGHGSLDYRLLEAESLTKTLYAFLSDLSDNLQEFWKISGSENPDQHFKVEAEVRDLGNFSASDVSGTNAVASFGIGTNEVLIEEYESDDNAESGTELVLEAVQDVIDRLYKLSTKIRNPSTRQISAKAYAYTEIDPDTGIDLMRSFLPFDYAHILAIYENYNVKADEPIGIEKEYLIKRLSDANSQRRRQFAHWKYSHDKKAKMTQQTSLRAPIPNPFLNLGQPTTQTLLSSHKPFPQIAVASQPMSVTTATQLPRQLLHAEDLKSSKSVSEYVPSLWNPGMSAVSFPPPPRHERSQKFFECPYCFTICPSTMLAEKAWR